MGIQLTTPSSNGSQFTVNLNSKNRTIDITSHAGNRFSFHLSAIRDLYLWLRDDCGGQWVLLGTKGEEETPNVGTVEEWARSPDNPIGDWYGLTAGRRGRFASFIPPILELLDLVELEHNAQNNRIRALPVTAQDQA